MNPHFQHTPQEVTVIVSLNPQTIAASHHPRTAKHNDGCFCGASEFRIIRRPLCHVNRVPGGFRLAHLLGHEPSECLSTLYRRMSLAVHTAAVASLSLAFGLNYGADVRLNSPMPQR